MTGLVRCTTQIGPRANLIPSVHRWLVAFSEAPTADSLQWGGQNTQPHFSVSSTGWQFRSGSHSGYVFWPSAAFMGQRCLTSLKVFSKHLTSTLPTVCTLLTQSLLTQSCWWYHPLDAQPQRACLPSGFSRCTKRTAVICQEWAVADDLPSRNEDCTFSVVVWRRLDNPDCTAQYSYCLAATTDCRCFCLLVWFCMVPLQCLWHDSVTLISTLLLTYLL